MPLYIRDDAVDALADQLRRATGARSKTEAVRAALQAQLEELKRKKPLIERVRDLQARADAIGAADPNFDMKKYTDEMWDNM